MKQYHTRAYTFQGQSYIVAYRPINMLYIIHIFHIRVVYAHTTVHMRYYMALTVIRNCHIALMGSIFTCLQHTLPTCAISCYIALQTIQGPVYAGEIFASMRGI